MRYFFTNYFEYIYNYFLFSKIVTAIKIAKRTRTIVWQNIIIALGVKFIVLALGIGGHATMWEAVFADVGVALIAILNAMRVMKGKF